MEKNVLGKSAKDVLALVVEWKDHPHRRIVRQVLRLSRPDEVGPKAADAAPTAGPIMFWGNKK